MEGRLGYATGVSVGEDGEFTVLDACLVRLGDMVPVREIDLSAGAAIVTADVAGRLKETGDVGESEAVVTAVVGRETEGAGTPLGPSRPPPDPADAVHHVALRLRLDSRGLFGLNRALSSLREQSSELEVELTVRASARDDTGYDRVRLRNGVIEPLEEGSLSVDQELT